MTQPKSKYVLLSGVLATVLVVDQWTKQIIHSHFRWGESLPLIKGLFSLTYVRNKGAAFGFLHSAPEWFREPFFMAVPVVAISVLSFLYYRLKPGQMLSAWAIALILSGALGNLIDRVRFGYVVDFLDVYLDSFGHWPAFNIADSCIVVGVGLIMLQSFMPTQAD